MRLIKVGLRIFKFKYSVMMKVASMKSFTQKDMKEKCIQDHVMQENTNSP